MIRKSPDLDMEQIARQHYQAVFRFCVRRVGYERAADVSQETFLTAQRVLHKFRGESTMTTWLFGIALNECRRANRRLATEPLIVSLESDLSANLSDGESSIVDKQVVNEAIVKLSLEHREVVILHELDGLTYEEIATILRVPVGTVKSRLHHAFQHLRRVLIQPEEAIR